MVDRMLLGYSPTARKINVRVRMITSSLSRNKYVLQAFIELNFKCALLIRFDCLLPTDWLYVAHC